MSDGVRQYVREANTRDGTMVVSSKTVSYELSGTGELDCVGE